MQHNTEKDQFESNNEIQVDSQQQSNISWYPSFFEFSDIEDYSESPSNSSIYLKDSYYTSHHTDDLNNGIQRSLLWNKPKSVKKVDLKLFGVKFSGKMEKYVELEQKFKFDYSIDGKYFIFVKDKIVLVLDCKKGWLTKKLKYKSKPHHLYLSKDSNYLLVSLSNFIGDDDQKIIVKFYVYNLNNFKRVLKDKFMIELIMEFEKNMIEYSIQQDYLHLFYFNNYQLIGKIFNLQNGLQIRSITFFELSKSLYYEGSIVDFESFSFTNNIIIINTHYIIDSEVHNLGCLLYNGKGKIMKTLKNYTIVRDLFCLEVDNENPNFYTYRLSNIVKGKLIKKIEAGIYSKSRYRFLQKYVRLIRLKNDLLIQTNLSESLENDPYNFYTVEIKCFNFKRRRCYYKGRKQINEKGAFEPLNDNIIKFYQF